MTKIFRTAIRWREPEFRIWENLDSRVRGNDDKQTVRFFSEF